MPLGKSWRVFLMSKNGRHHQRLDGWMGSAEGGWVLEMYDLFMQSPESVDAELGELFKQYGAPSTDENMVDFSAAGQVDPNHVGKVLAAVQLADAIRAHGHLAADIYPLNDRPKDSTRLDPSSYGLTESDLIEIPATLLMKNAPKDIQNGLQVIEHLKSFYTDKIAYEFAHIINPQERQWIQSKIESSSMKLTLSTEERKALLKRLSEIEGFEKFIHRTFVGAKRFSIEGLDTLVDLFV